MAFATALLVFGFQSWQVWQLRTYMDQHHDGQYSMSGLAVSVGYLDETMVTAARMYAGTGGERWKRDYLHAAVKLNEAFVKMRALAEDKEFAFLTEELSSVNDQLQAIETEAIAWAGRGLGEQALALLGSVEYEQHRAQYMSTWVKLIGMLNRTVRQAEELLGKKTDQVLFVFRLALPALVGLSVLAMLFMARYLRTRREADILAVTSLAQARTRYEAVVENMNDGLAVYQAVDDGEDFAITAFNAGQERIDNKTRGDVLGRRLNAALPVVKRSGLLEVLRRVWSSGQAEIFPMPVMEGDEVQGWREYYLFRLPGDEVASVCTDRTEEKMALVEMERSERRFRTLYNKTPVMLHSIDAETRLVAVSDYWLEVMGYSRDEVIGRPLFDFLTDKSRRFAKDVILPRFFALGKVENVPYELVTRDGRIIEILLSAISERDKRGAMKNSLAVLVDVTARNRAEAGLKESEQRHRTLYNKTPVMLHSIDADSRLVAVSDYWLEVMGYERDEVIGRYSHEFMDEESARLSRDVIVPEFFVTGTCTDQPYTMVTKGGREIEVLLSATADRDEKGAIIRSLSVLVDVTARNRAEAALKESEERLRNVALTSGDWIWQVNAEGKYVYASESVERILGFTPEEMYGLSPFELMTEGHAEQVRELFKEVIARREPLVDVENWNRTKYGRRVCLLTNGVPIYDRGGGFAGYFGVDKDITERKKTHYRLQLFGKLFETTLEGICITDSEGAITEVNQAFSNITGYSPDEVLGHNPRILKSDRHAPEFYEGMWSDIISRGGWEGEIWNRRKDGEAYPEWLSISAIRDDDGYVSHYVGVFHDITEIKLKEEQIRFQANHDALTGLPNRNLLLDRLGVSLARAKRRKHMAAVVYVDLDNFKTVNDSLGHTAGDELLLLVAERFKGLVQEESTVARLGGDEFAFLVDNVADEAEPAHVALQVIESMERPFTLGGRELYISPSIGIALYPGDGEDPVSLLKHADLAMYQAKDQGRNQYRLFTNELNRRARRRLDLESDLRRAVSGGDLFLVYQPKVDVKDLRVRGMEALVRWRRGDEVVSPDEFIGLAEETGLIVPLGLHVLNLACRQCREVLQEREPGFRVSVNLSGRQFHTTDLTETVRRVLKKNKLPADRLEVEITESVLAGDMEEVVGRISALNEIGVSVSVDDFGTGYSSLAYLKNFPISTLKIDRAFIMGLGRDAGDENIVKTVVQLARNFGLTVVAEGVEEPAQYRLLKELGCDLIQGYLFSKPLEWKDFKKFLKKCDPCDEPV